MMFISDVLKKEECRNEALQELQKLGIKCRPKKRRKLTAKSTNEVFKVPLSQLQTEIVTLKTGQQIRLPKLIQEMCSLILPKVSTEGLFRKEGSKVRQADMKAIINIGGSLDEDSQIIDVAALLKTFLRELPEPVIPHTHHEIFLKCVVLNEEAKTQALLLACLLLPTEHLNTLTYLLQFLHNVSEHSERNKMNVYNLAVVISPAIFPIEDKLPPRVAQHKTTQICEIIQILIENALSVGILPDSIIGRLESNTCKRRGTSRNIFLRLLLKIFFCCNS